MIINFNLDYWPIVYFKLSDNIINDCLFDEYKEYYLNLLLRCKKNNEKMVIICNLNSTGNIPISYVLKLAHFNKEIYKFNKEYIKCACILYKDNSFKNILNFYFTIVKPANPYKLTKSLLKVNKYLKDKFNIEFDTHVFNNEASIIEEDEEEEEKQYNEKEENQDQNQDQYQNIEEYKEHHKIQYKCENISI